jgi:heterodisulfide reductase subunit A
MDMANIRNQCSWVHSKDRRAATEKAKDLVRMSAARASELKPLSTGKMSMNKTAIVVGGGAAGMTAALSFAAQGFAVHLIEKEAELGGNRSCITAWDTGINAARQATAAAAAAGVLAGIIAMWRRIR